jgi:hypothetical protein
MADNQHLDILFRKFRECVESEFADGFLAIILDLMALVVLVDQKYKRNVHSFNARYLFRTQDGKVAATALFHHDRMDVVPWEMSGARPNIVIRFRDAKALMGFLLARNPDILGAMLRQDVMLEGNLNYLYKFAYMARHLQLMANECL